MITDKIFRAQLRELTDEAIRESLAEISVEFERRFATPPTTDASEQMREAAESALHYLAPDPSEAGNGIKRKLTRALALPAKPGDADLRALVIAARRAFDAGDLPDEESRALDQALERFSTAIPYENQADA